MLRTIAAIALAFHGLIHLIGFFALAQLAAIRGFAYSTTIAWGRLNVGDEGALAIGVAWLVATLLFLAAATGLWRGASWAEPLTAAAAALSVALCIAGSPAALPGAIIDVFILTALVLVQLLRTAGSPLLGGQ